MQNVQPAEKQVFNKRFFRSVWGLSAKSWGRTLVLEGLFCSLIAFRNVLDVSVFLLRKFGCLCPHALTVCITD